MTLPHSAKLLKPFCHARVSNEVKVPSSLVPSTKGKVADIALDKHCLVVLAWNVRSERYLKLKLPSAGAASAAGSAAAPAPAPVAPLVVKSKVGGSGGGGGGNVWQPLRDEKWCARVAATLEGATAAAVQKPTVAQLELADIVTARLRARLKSHHIPAKVEASRQDHWTLEFTDLNLSAAVAVMVLFGQVKPDVSCVNERGSLLSSAASFVPAVGDKASLVGVYLYLYAMAMIFIRTGKVVS